MQKYLRYAIYTGLFAILFTPFIVANGFFFPFITGKAFFFRVIVEIIVALWLVLALKEPGVRPSRSVLLYALGAFVVSLGISTVFAENPSKSFWSNFERMEGYITILHLGAYFLVASSMLASEKLWRRFLNTSIGISVAVALYGVAQLAGIFTINQGGVRVDATFGNATYLAVYMLFHFFLTLIALVEWKPKRWHQVAYATALVLQASMIFYTATRGTILGLLGGLFLSGFLFALFAKGRPTLRKAGVALIALIIAISGGFFLIKDTELVRGNDILTRIASISLAEGETRFTIWGMAWRGFEERPLFGWGQENFNYVFNTYFDPSLYGQEPWFDRVHNIFLDWLIAGGIFGLALYLSLFAIALWYLWKPRSVFSLGERVLITGLLAGYGFHNLFVFDNLMSYVLFFSLLAYVTWRGTGNREQRTDDREQGAENRGRVLSGTAYSVSAAAILLAGALAVYAANVPGIARATGIINAMLPQPEGVAQNFEEFKKVIGPSGMGRQEAHEQLVFFALQLRDPNLASLSSEALRQEVALYARDAFQEELERTPDDARLQVFYGSFLRALGDAAGATSALERAQELSPQKQSTYFERAALAFDQGDVERGLSLLQQAYLLEPRYDRARALYAATLLRADFTKEADALLIERYKSVTPPEPLIIEAYIDTGNRERLLKSAQELVAKAPDNFQYRLQLAGVYLEAGDRAHAVSELREAIRINPDFKEQGEAYIDDIEAGRPIQ